MIDNKNTIKELERALAEATKTQIYKEIDCSNVAAAAKTAKAAINNIYGTSRPDPDTFAKIDLGQWGSHIDDRVVVTCKKPEEPKVEEPEKWIWVEGYKGMDKNMQGHGEYQFEVGKRYDMPTDITIQDCKAGFHLSLNLKDVFKHFRIGRGNRFFKVKALVREKDYNEYGKRINTFIYGGSVRDKLASQSIEIIRELTVEEIFKDTEWASWSDEYKKLAMATGIDAAHDKITEDELVELGYSRPFASMITQKGRTSVAKAVASQPELSMDMKALMILNW